MKQTGNELSGLGQCALLGGLSLGCGVLSLLWMAGMCFPGLVLGAVGYARLTRLGKTPPGGKGLRRAALALTLSGAGVSLLVTLAFTVQLTGRAGTALF